MSNLPVPPSGLGWWGRFTADPRTHGVLLASDADREVAVSVLQDAFAEGRLTQAEQDRRIGQALAGRTLGDFVPLLNDLPATMTSPAARPAARPATSGRRLLDDRAVRAWLGLAVLFNVIWLAASLGGGFHLDYYWPIWPMLGTGIPLILAWINGSTPDDLARRRLDRKQEALNRRQAALDRRSGTASDRGPEPYREVPRELR